MTKKSWVAFIQSNAVVFQVVSVLVAVLGLCFVVLGLFREQLIRSLVTYPKISLNAHVTLPHCHVAPMSWLQLEAEFQGQSQPLAAAAPPGSNPHPSRVAADKFWVQFCRVFVKNEGTGEVTDVEVFLSSMWDLSKSGTAERINEFLPLNLRWANSWRFYRPQPKLESEEPLRKARISAGIGRFCDLGFIVEPNFCGRYLQKTGITDELENHGTAAVFQFALEALQTAHGRSPNIHRLLELAIDGSNMETEFFYIELKVMGEWDPHLDSSGNPRGAKNFVLCPASRKLMDQAGILTPRSHPLRDRLRKTMGRLFR